MDGQTTSITSPIIITVMLIIAVILGILIIGIALMAEYKIFKKAGQPGWAAFVPVYNYVILCRIAGLSMKDVMLSYFLPRYQGSILTENLGKAFGRSYVNQYMFFGSFYAILT